MDEATRAIRQQWQQQNSDDMSADALEKHYLDIADTATEWEQLTSNLESRSLFNQQILFQARYTKKTLTKTAKTSLMDIAQQPNPANLLIFQAPLCKIKDFQMFKALSFATLVQITSLNAQEFPQWVFAKLQQHFPTATLEMAQLITQYTQGNAFAATQAIQKLALFISANEPLSLENVQDQLHHQCEYQTFELSDACLKGDAHRAIHILRAHTKISETPLLLWILSNEIRQLLALAFSTKSMPFQEACRAHNIWSSKIGLYQAASKRLANVNLQRLHHLCMRADECLKSGKTLLLRDILEQIALGLCGHTSVLSNA